MSAQVEPAGALEGSSPGGPLRLRLDISYDGTDFHGWARQPGLRTVQGTLESAVRAVLRVPAEAPVRVAVAGRTDAGVHAVGQVCHCDVLSASVAGALNGRNSRSASPSRGPSATSSGEVERPGAGESNPSIAGGADVGVPDVEADPVEPWRVESWAVERWPVHGERVARLVRRLNGVLPADLRVRRVSVAPAGFDARWSAAWREYTYLVADDPVDGDPRLRGHVLSWRPLDVAEMQAAAEPFVGEHDFAAFCRAREGASTVRTIHALGWSRRRPVGDGPGLAEFRIRSDAFCHSMVRALVGSFLAVGEGRWPVDRPATLLAARVRVPALATAPAHGLTLDSVGYPPDAELAEQALRARRWRGR